MQHPRWYRALVFGIVCLLGGAVALEAQSPKEEANGYIKDLRESKDAKVRAKALDELGRLGSLRASLTKEAIPDMMAALKDKDSEVRRAAAGAIGKVDPPDAKAVFDALMTIIKNDKEEAKVRTAAMRSLVGLGDTARSAVGTLKKIQEAEKDKNKMLSRTAGDVAKALGGKKN